MNDMPPDRLSADASSPFYNAEMLERGVGIRFKGAEKNNVEEYCVSEGGLQLRIEAGSMPGWILSHFGNYHRP